MTTVEQVLNEARSHLGYVEEPGNRTRYGRWYGLDGQPWCAMWVSYVAAHSGATAIIPKHAYTPAGAAWYKARGTFGPTPKVGAIVFYDIAGMGRISHVGIVEAVHPDGTWVAIEGNTDVAGGRTGGRVMRQHRRRVGLRGGFGYPAYDRAPVAAAPVRPTPAAPAPAPPAPPFPLPAGWYFGPESGPRQSVSGYHGRGEHLATWQARMVMRGWRLSVDGRYGPQTAGVARAFQTEKGLRVDALIGPQTWAAAWTAPLT